MTYTTQQLQAMSDDELFDALGEKFNSYVRRSALHEDIMPLAFERFINMQHSGIDWIAFKGDHQFMDTNPLRAIACLLLMMED